VNNLIGLSERISVRKKLQIEDGIKDKVTVGVWARNTARQRFVVLLQFHYLTWNVVY